MTKFRKRPVEIEAHQWFHHGDIDGITSYNTPPGFCCAQCGEGREAHGFIDTLEDGHRVCPGDWIITGVKGERYPCKPDIFEATYEPV
jgi:hypothetical protein